MKNILTIVTITLFLIGCGAKPSVETDYKTSSRPAVPEVPADVPTWFMDTPSEDDTYYYATAVADMRSMQNAINRATQDGQRQLSEAIKVQVQSMVKNYTQEAGINETVDVIEFYESVSKSVSNNTMSGAKVLKKFPYMKSSGGYKAYVLVGLSKSAVQGEVVSSIQNEESMYAQFKASQAFKELESETK